jgi:hypothetical protein
MTTPADLLRQTWASWGSHDIQPRGPAWAQWLMTLLFALAVALVFTLLGFAFGAGRDPARWLDGGLWWRTYRANLGIALTISVSIHLLFAALIRLVGVPRLKRASHAQRAVFFTGVPLAGVALGLPLCLWLLGPGGAGWLRLAGPGGWVGSLAAGLGISCVFFLFFNAKARQAEAEKRAVQAQLRLLQAQMEPHFLFNTLANVLTLIDIDSHRARLMLESFTDYLRSSLTSLRRDRTTVGHELELAEAYLRLMQLRMDDRLQFAIDADAAARSAVLPPLLLQPLVENAIHHGLEPKVDGGMLTISARLGAGVLTLTVADDGLGPDTAARRGGNGVAQANIRQRLQAEFGAAGSLRVEAAHPGTLATLSLPSDPAAA